jgi:Lar family restriction alleviation protein
MTTPIAAGPLDRRVSPLPCPFCGDTDVAVVEGSTFRWRQVECNNCGARCGNTRVQTIPPIDHAKNELWAIEEWNRRANAELRGRPAVSSPKRPA